jgi:hypothetical protein
MLHSTDWKKSRALLKQAPVPPAMPEIPFGVAPETGKAFVVASVLRLRAKPADKAETLRELPIGTELMLEGEAPTGWARARVRHDRTWAALAEGTPLALAEGKVVPTDLSAGYTTGFVPRAFLAAEAPQFAAVDAALRAAQEEKQADAAVIWAQRLHDLLPSTERAKSVVNLALDARRYDLAGRALVEPLRTTQPGTQAEVELTYYWGCKGDPRDAAPVVLSDSLASPAADCIDFTEPRACDACTHSDAPPELLTKEQLASQEAEFDEAIADAAARQKVWDTRVAALRTQYPKGPWLRLRVDAELARAGRKLFVAVVKFDPNERFADPDVLEQLIEVPFSPSTEASLVDTFLPVGAEEARRYELHFAPSQEEARKLVLPASEDAVPAVPAASWIRSAEDCSCGC